jgi:hypothetical protein
VAVRRRPLVAGSALALLVLVTSMVIAPLAPGVSAQEATPAAGATPVAPAAVARPVHIHSGDCTTLGEVVFPLTDLVAPVGTGGGQADEAAQAESSFTVVPVSLADLLAGEYAINAHLSPEEIGTYIACGEIGGVVDVNGALIVGLRESSGSGFTGIAFLQPDADGVSTDVSVFVAPVLGAAG